MGIPYFISYFFTGFYMVDVNPYQTKPKVICEDPSVVAVEGVLVKSLFTDTENGTMYSVPLFFCLPSSFAYCCRCPESSRPDSRMQKKFFMVW